MWAVGNHSAMAWVQQNTAIIDIQQNFAIPSNLSIKGLFPCAQMAQTRCNLIQARIRHLLRKCIRQSSKGQEHLESALRLSPHCSTRQVLFGKTHKAKRQDKYSHREETSKSWDWGNGEENNLLFVLHSKSSWTRSFNFSFPLPIS